MPGTGPGLDGLVLDRQVTQQYRHQHRADDRRDPAELVFVHHIGGEGRDRRRLEDVHDVTPGDEAGQLREDLRQRIQRQERLLRGGSHRIHLDEVAVTELRGGDRTGELRQTGVMLTDALIHEIRFQKV